MLIINIYYIIIINNNNNNYSNKYIRIHLFFFVIYIKKYLGYTYMLYI